jgi:co-chaperonin GroES (HSP10)
VLNQFVGTKIKVDGAEQRIINTDDVLGVYKEQ